MENDTPQKRVKARARMRLKRERDRVKLACSGPAKKKYQRPDTSTSGWDTTSSDTEVTGSVPLDEGSGPMEGPLQGISISRNSDHEDVQQVEVDAEADVQSLHADAESSDQAEHPGPPGPPDGDESFVEIAQVPKDARWFATELLKVRMQSDVSNSGIQKILDIFLPNMQDISNLVDYGHISQSFRHGILPKAGCDIPQIRCSIKILRRNLDGTEDIIRMTDLKEVPRKYRSGSSDTYTLLCQSAYATLDGIKRHFEKLHKNYSQVRLHAIFSNTFVGIDGVRETEHGSRTLVVITLMLEGCILPWKIHNPMLSTPGASLDIEELLRPLVQEINDDPVIIARKFLCDMVERHHIKGLKGHTGHHSCEICEAPGNGPGGKLDFDYPRSTKFKVRSNTRWRQIARKIKRGLPINRRGLRSYSPLLDLEYPFDIVWDVPVDEFHLCKEGLTKQMLVKILTGTSITAKEIHQKFSDIYVQMQVFSETPRRTRRLQYIRKFKGSEFGVLMFSCLPSLFKDCIPATSDYWRNVKKCLAVYAFLVRLYFYDDATYRDICNEVDIRKCHQTFYRLFEKCFCSHYNKGVNPNAHIFWHLPLIREHTGPLWKTSTEPIEAYYAKFHRCFRKGTPNVPAQIMTALYKIDELGHRCRNNFQMTITESVDTDRKFCDSYVTDNRGGFWKVMEEIDGNTFVCAKVITTEICTGLRLGLGAPLPWNKVGVQRFQEVDYSGVQLLTRQEIRGKFMRCGKYVLEWQPEWFRDSKKSF